MPIMNSDKEKLWKYLEAIQRALFVIAGSLQSIEKSIEKRS